MESRRHPEPASPRALRRVRLLLVLLLAPVVATAHTGSSSYGEISLDERDVGIALQVSLADWLPIVDLDTDHDGLLTREEEEGEKAHPYQGARSRRLGVSARLHSSRKRYV